MAALVIIGYATIIGVVIIAVIETKRMEEEKPSILSSLTPKDTRDKGKRLS
jgi:hypothetical protein